MTTKFLVDIATDLKVLIQTLRKAATTNFGIRNQIMSMVRETEFTTIDFYKIFTFFIFMLLIKAFPNHDYL